MAEKGFSLNPGADPTLVAAAYRAAMANVPKDLSGTYEALAKSYDDTMKSVSESWSNVIKTVAKLGAPLIKQAIKNNFAPIAMEGYMYDRPKVPIDTGVSEKTETEEYADIPGLDKGEVDVSEETKTEITAQKVKLEPISLADRFREIRKELKSLGVKQDKASRIRRHELRTERTHLFNSLEFLENTDNFTNDNLAKGLVDLDASGKMAVLMQSALAAYKTKSGKILGGDYAGYYVSLASDENDDFNFILRNANGDIVTGEDLDGKILTEKGGTPYSISMNDLADNLVPKTDQKVLDALSKRYNGLRDSNAKLYDQTGHRNFVAGYVRDEASLFGIIQHALGSNKTSWVEDLNGGINGEGSVESATIFGGMSDIKLAGMGIVDVGKKGYDAEDFLGLGLSENQKSVATNNYKIVKDSLLNRKSKNYDFKTTQRMFLDYGDRIGNEMHAFKPGGTPNTTSLEKAFPSGTNYGTTKGGTSITGNTFHFLYNQFDSGTLTLKNDTWIVDPKTNIWKNKKGNTKSGSDMLRVMQPEKGPSMLTSTIFARFRGQAGGGLDGNFPTGLWGGDVTETGVVNKLNAAYKDTNLKGMFTEADMSSNYVVKFNGIKYNLQDDGDEQKLKDAIAAYDPLNPN